MCRHGVFTNLESAVNVMNMEYGKEAGDIGKNAIRSCELRFLHAMYLMGVQCPNKRGIWEALELLYFIQPEQHVSTEKVA